MTQYKVKIFLVTILLGMFISIASMLMHTDFPFSRNNAIFTLTCGLLIGLFGSLPLITASNKPSRSRKVTSFLIIAIFGFLVIAFDIVAFNV